MDREEMRFIVWEMELHAAIPSIDPVVLHVAEIDVWRFHLRSNI